MATAKKKQEERVEQMQDSDGEEDSENNLVDDLSNNNGFDPATLFDHQDSLKLDPQHLGLNVGAASMGMS